MAWEGTDDQAGGKGRYPNSYVLVSMTSPALDTSTEDEESSEQSPEVPEDMIWPREKLAQVVSGKCQEREGSTGQEPSAGTGT